MTMSAAAAPHVVDDSDDAFFLRIVGLSRHDLAEVARIGAAAFLAQRFERAAVAFDLLAALDPHEASHLLHLAAARRGEGQWDDAVAAIEAYFSLDAPRPLEDVRYALELHAALLDGVDDAAAEQSRAAAATLGAPSARRRA